MSLEWLIWSPVQDPGNQWVYSFQPENCDGGLPHGKCDGFLTKAEHSGADQDWMVLLPDEENGPGMVCCVLPLSVCCCLLYSVVL